MLSDESQRSSVIAYTITVYAVALTLVALRVAGKTVSSGVAWNDAPIVAAVLLAAVPIACVLASELSKVQMRTRADTAEQWLRLGSASISGTLKMILSCQSFDTVRCQSNSVPICY